MAHLVTGTVDIRLQRSFCDPPMLSPIGVIAALVFVAACTDTSSRCDTDADCFAMNGNLLSRPICLQDGRCVQCTSDVQCGEQAPICDVPIGDCVQCFFDADCLDPTPHCFERTRCVQCLNDTDCEGLTPICQLTTGACVQCFDNLDCTDPTRARCSEISNACVACNDDANCQGVGQGVQTCNAGVCEPLVSP